MISFFILARYLEKSDFGIIAGCFVVQGFFKVLTNVGSGHYLIRKDEIKSEDLDVAWTINVTTRTLIAFMIFILSDSAAEFMKIPELSFALKIMCLSPLFIGLNNPALNIKIKSLDYQAISYLKIITKTISTTLSLIIAITYKNYWAIVIAEVTYQVVYALGSYIIVSYKPKFRFNKMYQQWSFSKWILLKGIVSYAKNKCDKIIVSRSYSLVDLGIYNFSLEASSIVVNILMAPVSSIFYAGLSDYVNDKSELVDKLYKFVIVISFIYTPIVFGGVYLSELIIPVVFGEKWSDATSLFSLFLIMTYSGCFVRLLSDMFILIDEVKKHFLYELFSSLIIIIVVVSLSSFSLLNFSIGRVLISYFILFSMLIFLSTMLPISMLYLAKLVILPVFISTMMLLFIHMLNIYMVNLGDIYVLCLSIGSGFFFYLFLSLFMLRTLRGKVSYYSYLYDSVILKIYSVLLSKLGSKFARFGL